MIGRLLVVLPRSQNGGKGQGGVAEVLQRLNFNGTAFPKSFFKTDNVRQQRTGPDCGCFPSKQLEERCV